ncbi:MAG: hypothetical protein HYZ53_20135 [Planctomycetes bacterium]|nr:hypothetical protein [Planctomycetota bacterium]
MGVKCVSPERSSLVSFFLESLLGRKLATPQGARAFAGLDRVFLLDAGGVKTTLRCKGGTIEIHPGEAGAWDAGISADLATLLAVGLGGDYLWPVLSGRLRLRGNPLLLLPLLGLLRAPDPPAARPAAAPASSTPPAAPGAAPHSGS